MAPFVTPYGVKMILEGSNDQDRGYLIDDMIPPLEWNLNDSGPIVTYGYGFNAYVDNYTLAIVEIFYMPVL